MIERYDFGGDWYEVEEKTLLEYFNRIKKVYQRPCKIHSTNQDDFEDRVYLYHWDSMGHMNWLRMPEDDYREQRGELYKEQEKDYDLYTDKRGFVSKTPHTICGRCDRCKTCGDCKCEDKHKDISKEE